MQSGVEEHLSAELPSIFDRQIRAFGKEGQRVLNRLRVGVVGVGGTGSSVVEQITRLGVGEIVAVDFGDLEKSNVTRVYGSSINQENQSKVLVASENVRRIGLGTTFHGVEASISDRDATLDLAQCDLIFGCTDDHTGRAILSRMPSHLLQVLIDCGVSVQSNAGNLIGIFVRVSKVVPLDPCLICLGDVDSNRLRDEGLPRTELESRRREGYVQDSDERNPAVVAYTTMAATFAVNEMICMLFGLSDSSFNKLLIRPHHREMSGHLRERQGRHSCGDAERLASGLVEPFLGWDWRRKDQDD
jgi:molybdopterin/thiamine biosynthesis adenylyltransferase